MEQAGIRTAESARGGPRRLAVSALAVLLLFAVAGAIAWPMRFALARDYIDAAMARRGVRASYEVSRLDLGAEAFEHLVIGDPARPDLVADHVEVQLAFGFTGPAVGLITARGVRINGRIEEGRLKLGELDRLIEPATSEPFRLPDQRVDVRDAALTLETPAGVAVLAFAGRGNLSDGFRGGIGVVAKELRVGGCVLTGTVARLGLRVENARPRLHGPAAMTRADCEGFTADRPSFALNALLSQALDQWRGTTSVRVASLSAQGQALTALQGHVSFEGDAERTAGSLIVATGAAAAAAVHATRTAFDGRYAASAKRGQFSLAGKFGAFALTLDGSRSFAVASRRPHGGPAPIGEALTAALRNVGRGGADAIADLDLDRNGGGTGFAHFRRLSLVAPSDAPPQDGDGLVYRWPNRAGR